MPRLQVVKITTRGVVTSDSFTWHVRGSANFDKLPIQKCSWNVDMFFMFYIAVQVFRRTKQVPSDPTSSISWLLIATVGHEHQQSWCWLTISMTIWAATQVGKVIHMLPILRITVLCKLPTRYDYGTDTNQSNAAPSSSPFRKGRIILYALIEPESIF